MIILPDRHQPVGKILLPMKRIDWMLASATQGVKYRWYVTARLADGHPVWRGWFDDREDADAFLYAIVLGSLKQQRQLWDLPSPAWQSDLGGNLSYDFATVTFLTSPTGSNQTYSTPADWNNSNNSIEVIGGGSAGAGGNGGGGGGGAYSKIVNLTLSGSITYQIGSGVAGTTGGAPAAGGDSWFNGSTLGASSVGAKGGSGASGTTGGLGGASASGIGTTKNSGGDGGNGGSAGGGGGGAAGPSGVGNNGTSSSGNTPGSGGSGDAGSGGSSGAGGNPPSAGGNGNEWDASHGPGGGGGGGAGGVNVAGASGGNYGGAGGGAGFTSSFLNAGSGIQGIIVVKYILVLNPGLNIPLLLV